jgi:hypothetical protein
VKKFLFGAESAKRIKGFGGVFGKACMFVGGRILLLSVAKKQTGRTWTGLNWLTVGTNGGLL